MSLSVDQRLSHYRLLEKLGEGGMGVVWRAVDTALDREVALKVLADTLQSDPDWLARFRHEARIVAALNHPNIVTIHAIEEVDGRLFLAMELVRGRRLDELLPAGGLPLDTVFRLAIPMIEAVGAAHDRGVTHRDLKPANVMVGHDGQLKILDFGMARSHEPVVSEHAEESTTRTLPSFAAIEGTVPYMSPEQINGDTTDYRSDLFSLGVVLYEMVTGQRPFRGRSRAGAMASTLRDDPTPVSEARPGLPRQLGRIIDHALRKDPDRRFQTARDLRNELEQLREELDGGTGSLDLKSLAVLPLADLSDDPERAYFADGMTDLLINNLGRIGALKVISRTSVMRYRNSTQPLRETARELGVEAVVEGSVLRAGQRVRVTAQLIDAIRDRLLWAESFEHDLEDVLALQARVAREIAERIEVELTPQEHAHLSSVRTIAPAVHEAYMKGRHLWYKRTTDSVRQGLHCFEEALRLDPTFAPAHAGVADSYIVDGGRYLGVSPDVAYGHARASARRAVELDDHLAEAHTSLAAVLTDYDWDWTAADREYRRAIELNPSYATARSWYAEHLSRMGRHDEAVTQVRLVPELDPASIFSSMIVAWILYFARRYDEAIRQGLRTLEIDPDYATAHRILGWAYGETRRYDEAIASLRRASELAGGSPNFTAHLGRAYALAGRAAEAREMLDDLTKAAERTYVSSLDIALIHTALDDRDRAFEWLERAYRERADHLPYLEVDPRLDTLRDDPRFGDLLGRLGLGPSADPVPTG